MPKSESAVARKNYRLHQAKIDRAREILGTTTETETIEQALELVAFGDRLLAGVDRMRGKRLADVFADADG
jgi:hypothetical protein